VALSVGPGSLELPLLDAPRDSIFMIELKISNVQNLKEFHFNFGYDSNFMEFLGGKIDNSFYLQSRGWTGDEFDGVLADAFSGSGVMFRYWFKAVNTGTTQINLANVKLLDVGGNSISAVTSGCAVTIISKTAFIGGEYVTLSDSYQQLLTLFNDTILITNQLTSLYNLTKNNYNNLDSLYASLNNKYDLLNSNYVILQTNYDSLQNNLNSLQTINDKIRLDFGYQTNMLYFFIATTVIFLFTTLFFAITKSGKGIIKE
jgi:hypothetical protein